MFFPVTRDRSLLNLFRIKLTSANRDVYWTIERDTQEPVAFISLQPLIQSNVSAIVETQLFFFELLDENGTRGHLYNLAHQRSFPDLPVVVDGNQLCVAHTDTGIDLIMDLQPEPIANVQIPSWDPSEANYPASLPILSTLSLSLSNVFIGTADIDQATGKFVGLGSTNFSVPAAWEVHNYPEDLYGLRTRVLTARENWNQARLRLDVVDNSDDLVHPFWDMTPGDPLMLTTVTSVTNLSYTVSAFPPSDLPYNMVFDFGALNSSENFLIQVWYPNDDSRGPYYLYEDISSFSVTQSLSFTAFSLNSTLPHAGETVTYLTLSNGFDLSFINTLPDDNLFDPSGFTITTISNGGPVPVPPPRPPGQYNTSSTLATFLHRGAPRLCSSRDIAVENPYFHYSIVRRAPLTLQHWEMVANATMRGPFNTEQTIFEGLSLTNWMTLTIQNEGSGNLLATRLDDEETPVFITDGRSFGPAEFGVAPPPTGPNLSYGPVMSVTYIPEGAPWLGFPDTQAGDSFRAVLSNNNGAVLTANNYAFSDPTTAPTYLVFPSTVNHVGWLASTETLSSYVRAFFALEDRFPEVCCILTGGDENTLSLCSQLSLGANTANCDFTVTGWCASNVGSLTNDFLYCNCLKPAPPGIPKFPSIYYFCLYSPCFTYGNAYKTAAMLSVTACPLPICLEALQKNGGNVIYWQGQPTADCGFGNNGTVTTTTGAQRIGPGTQSQTFPRNMIRYIQNNVNAMLQPSLYVTVAALALVFVVVCVRAMRKAR